VSEESTTPDVVELLRRTIEAASRRDLELSSRLLAPDSVWDMSPLGMGTFVYTHRSEASKPRAWRRDARAVHDPRSG